MGKGCLILIAIPLAGMFIFCGALFIRLKMDHAEYIANTTPEEREAARKESERRVEDQLKLTRQERLVKELVTSALKAPTTAKFNLESGWNKANEDELIVRGSVDSQNSFGAMIRAKVYSVSVGRANPQVVFLQLDDKILIDKLSTTP